MLVIFVSLLVCSANFCSTKKVEKKNFYPKSTGLCPRPDIKHPGVINELHRCVYASPTGSTYMVQKKKTKR